MLSPARSQPRSWSGSTCAWATRVWTQSSLARFESNLLNFLLVSIYSIHCFFQAWFARQRRFSRLCPTERGRNTRGTEKTQKAQEIWFWNRFLCLLCSVFLLFVFLSSSVGRR